MGIFAYIVYMFVVVIVGCILPSANVGLNMWQYWAVITAFIAVFLCGAFSN
jgi:hypothetical protein